MIEKNGKLCHSSFTTWFWWVLVCRTKRFFSIFGFSASSRTSVIVIPVLCIPTYVSMFWIIRKGLQLWKTIFTHLSTRGLVWWAHLAKWTLTRGRFYTTFRAAIIFVFLFATNITMFPFACMLLKLWISFRAYISS